MQNSTISFSCEYTLSYSYCNATLVFMDKEGM